MLSVLQISKLVTKSSKNSTRKNPVQIVTGRKSNIFSIIWEHKKRSLNEFILCVSVLLFVETILYQTDTNLFSTHEGDVVFDEKLLPLIATVDDVQLYKQFSSLFDQNCINMLFLKTIKGLQNSATVRNAVEQVCLVVFELVMTVHLYTHTEQ